MSEQEEWAKQTLAKRLESAAIRLCGGYYEPRTVQEGLDGALMLEAMNYIKSQSAPVAAQEPMNIYRLAAHLPGDVNWGEPITPSMVRHILSYAASQPAQSERQP
jgi:hypothetical protein